MVIYFLFCVLQFYFCFLDDYAITTVFGLNHNWLSTRHSLSHCTLYGSSLYTFILLLPVLLNLKDHIHFKKYFKRKWNFFQLIKSRTWTKLKKANWNLTFVYAKHDNLNKFSFLWLRFITSRKKYKMKMEGNTTTTNDKCGQEEGNHYSELKQERDYSYKLMRSKKGSCMWN